MLLDTTKGVVSNPVQSEYSLLEKKKLFEIVNEQSASQ